MRDEHVQRRGRRPVSRRRSLVWPLACGLVFGPALAARGQDPPAAAPVAGSAVGSAVAPDVVFKVRHDHALGSGRGELRITAGGFEFAGEGEEGEHSAAWRDEDIKRIEITKNAIEIFAYEAARIPVLPKQLPWVEKTKAVRVGTEREYEFHLSEGEVPEELVRALLARFKRPVGTTVVPNEPGESGELLFEIPAFHRHVSGGESGVLRAYKHHVIFAAEEEDHSRHWRYSDIRDVGRLGRWKLEIATWEDKAWTDGKSYVFDLKRPMTEFEYEVLWDRLYGRRAAP